MIGPKSLAKHAACNGQTNAEKYMERLQEILSQGTKTMLGKKVCHSSSHMSMQPSQSNVYQNLPEYLYDQCPPMASAEP